MASTLKVDEMQGVTSAGDITITSEGGSATQSLQQGLAKSWVLWNQSSPTVYDSLNVSSMTDSSTGFFDMNITNAMGSTNYVCHFNATVVSSHVGQALDVRNAATDTNASRIEVFYAENNAAQDSTRLNLTFLGDLA
jgi:hypothetical protein